ncbi:hypothetical protein [Nocardioides sp. L-11A]|uniref:hypothetical protein n=1 Tax=Nocardioides sp. L-11A TaxID=3043848 RepID=UPI00249B9BBC|nr:hypothetical protein QJ852_06480 [Nocardioides sp. L-11A]
MNDGDAENRQLTTAATSTTTAGGGEQCNAPTELNEAPTRKPARSLSGLQAYLQRLDPDGWMDVCEVVGRAQHLPPGQRRDLRALELVVAQLPQRNHAHATDDQLTDALTSVYVAEAQSLQATDERNSA